jgi:hypothetical protein
MVMFPGTLSLSSSTENIEMAACATINLLFHRHPPKQYFRWRFRLLGYLFLFCP